MILAKQKLFKQPRLKGVHSSFPSCCDVKNHMERNAGKALNLPFIMVKAEFLLHLMFDTALGKTSTVQQRCQSKQCRNNLLCLSREDHIKVSCVYNHGVNCVSILLNA